MRDLKNCLRVGNDSKRYELKTTPSLWTSRGNRAYRGFRPGDLRALFGWVVRRRGVSWIGSRGRLRRLLGRSTAPPSFSQPETSLCFGMPRVWARLGTHSTIVEIARRGVNFQTDPRPRRAADCLGGEGRDLAVAKPHRRDYNRFRRARPAYLNLAASVKGSRQGRLAKDAGRPPRRTRASRRGRQDRVFVCCPG